MHCTIITSPSRMFKQCKSSLITVADYEKIAKTKIAENYFNYFRRGNGEEQSLRLNVVSYQK